MRPFYRIKTAFFMKFIRNARNARFIWSGGSKFARGRGGCGGVIPHEHRARHPLGPSPNQAKIGKTGQNGLKMVGFDGVLRQKMARGRGVRGSLPPESGDRGQHRAREGARILILVNLLNLLEI